MIIGQKILRTDPIRSLSCHIILDIRVFDQLPSAIQTPSSPVTAIFRYRLSPPSCRPHTDTKPLPLADRYVQSHVCFLSLHPFSFFPTFLLFLTPYASFPQRAMRAIVRHHPSLCHCSFATLNIVPGGFFHSFFLLLLFHVEYCFMIVIIPL